LYGIKALGSGAASISIPAGSRNPIYAPKPITIPKGGYVPHFIVMDGNGRSVPEALRDADQPTAGQRAEIIPAKVAAHPALAVAGSSSPPLAPSRLRLLKRRRWLASILSLLLVLSIVSWGATLLLQPRILADGRGTAVPGPPLMVPPFANDSGDPALNSFAKGITENVIGGLIGFENVRVFGVDPRSRYDAETALRAALVHGGRRTECCPGSLIIRRRGRIPGVRGRASC
jgi:hypothetical protein